MSRFAHNTAFSSLAGLSSALGSMASAILAARLLGPAGSGTVIFGLWIVATTAAISDGGLSASLARYIPELAGQGKTALVPGLIRHLARPAMVLALGVPTAMIGIAALSEPYASWMDLDATFGSHGRWIILALCVAQTLANLYLCALRGLQRFAEVARLVLVSMIVQLAAIGAGAFWAGPIGAFFGYLAGSLGPALLAFRLLRRANPAPRDLRDRVRRYALFTWAANLTSLLVWSRLEIVFLKHSFGDEAVGMFAVGLTLASLAVQGPLLFTGGLLAYFSERSDADNRAAVQSALRAGTLLMAVVILPLSFGLCALTPALIPILYGPGFEAAAPAAIILIAVTGLGAIGTVGSNLLYSRERSDIVFYCNAGGGLLAVFGGFLVIPAFGLVGAAALRAVVQLAMLAAGWSFLIGRLGFSVPFRQLSLVLGSALCCALAAHLCLAAIPTVAVGMPLAILAGALVYLLSLRLLGALPREDLRTFQAAFDRAPRAIRASTRLITRLLGDERGTSPDLAATRSTAS